MPKYKVWLTSDDKMGVIKTYPYKLQAYIYCWLKGYVYYGRNDYFLDKRVKIEEVQDD